MPSPEIHPGKGRIWTLTYKQPDGRPGLVNTDSEPVITMNPAGYATVTPGAFVALTGAQDFAVEHNSNVGRVDITIVRNGDVGSGTVLISNTETFHMLGRGSVAADSSIGAERDTPV